MPPPFPHRWGWRESGADELILDVQGYARTGEEVLDITARIVDAADVREVAASAV